MSFHDCLVEVLITDLLNESVRERLLLADDRFLIRTRLQPHRSRPSFLAER